MSAKHRRKCETPSALCGLISDFMVPEQTIFNFFAVLTSFQSILTLLLPARSCSGHSFCSLPSAARINLDTFPQTHVTRSTCPAPHCICFNLLSAQYLSFFFSSNWSSLGNAHVYLDFYRIMQKEEILPRNWVGLLILFIAEVCTLSLGTVLLHHAPF